MFFLLLLLLVLLLLLSLSRAVFLGNYTQGQVDKGYKRAHAMLIPGILLLVADGACLIVIFLWCIFKYCKSSENVTLI